MYVYVIYYITYIYIYIYLYVHAVTCSCLLQSPKFHDSSWYTIFQHSACVPCLSGPSDVTQMFLSGKKSRAWLKVVRKKHSLFDRSSSPWESNERWVIIHMNKAGSSWYCAWTIRPRTRMYATQWIIGTQNRQSYESLIEKVQRSLCPHEFYPFWKTGHSPLKTVADIRPTSWWVPSPWCLTWVSIWGRFKKDGFKPYPIKKIKKTSISWQSACSCGQQQHSW